MSDHLLRSVARRAIYDQRRALVGFGVGLVAFSIMIGGIWPTVRDQGAEFQKLLDSYPPALKAAFDIGTFDGAGFLKGEMFSFMLPLLFLVFAVGRGADLIAGEEERGALDVLLSQPLSRRRILLEKAMGLLAGIGLLTLVTFVALAIVVTMGDFGVSLAKLAGASLLLYLLGAVFGIGALAIGALRGRRGLAIGGAAALAAALYLVQVVSRLVPSMEGAKWASPFYYYSGGDPLVLGLTAWHAMVLLALVGVLLAVAVIGFERRDVGV